MLIHVCFSVYYSFYFFFFFFLPFFSRPSRRQKTETITEELPIVKKGEFPQRKFPFWASRGQGVLGVAHLK